MILPLRIRHRRVFMVLGVFLPVVFAAGIAARKPGPSMAWLPKELVPPTQRYAATRWKRSGLFKKIPVQVQLLREQPKAGRFGIQLFAAKDFAKPDLLVYWVAGVSHLTDQLPNHAQLLGSFASAAPLPLPPDAGPECGALVLYSLADAEIVDSSTPFTPQEL